MDRDSFIEALREQYAEEIYEAYLECEHDNGKVVDYRQLNQALNKMMRTAKVDGLPEVEFKDLVSSELPQVMDKIELVKSKNAA